MSSRPSDGQSSRPPTGRQGSGFVVGLVALARLGLLAITFYGALNVVVNALHGATVSRTVGAAQGVTYFALTMAAAAAVLMVALNVNAAFLVDRLFSRRLAASLFAAVFVLAVGSVVVGRLGSAKLGAVAVVFVLVPAVPFVLSMLLVRLAGPAASAKSSSRPRSAPQPPAPGASPRPGRAPMRQRRAGRKR